MTWRFFAYSSFKHYMHANTSRKPYRPHPISPTNIHSRRCSTRVSCLSTCLRTVLLKTYLMTRLRRVCCSTFLLFGESSGHRNTLYFRLCKGYFNSLSCDMHTFLRERLEVSIKVSLHIYVGRHISCTGVKLSTRNWLNTMQPLHK